MDNELIFALGVSLNEPNEEVKELCRQLNPIFENDKKIVFAYDSNDEELYESLGDSLGYFTLGVFDKTNSKFYDRPELSQIFAKEGETEPDEIDLTFLADLSDFETEHQVEIQEAIDDVRAKFYKDNKPMETLLEKDGYSIEIPSDNKEDEEKNVEEPEEEVPRSQVTIDFDMVKAEKPANLNIQDEYDEEKSTQEDNENLTLDDNSVDEPMEEKYQPKYERGQIDPLLTLASDIFENNAQATLPVFDEYTRQQLRNSISKSESIVHEARDKAIFSIYEILKENKESFEEQFEKDFAESTSKHENTLKVIDDNLEAQIKEKKLKNEEAYTKAQLEFVKSQAQVLKEQYDNEHKQSFLDNLNTDVDDLKNDAQKKIAEENAKFNKHHNEESFKFITGKMRKLDFSTIFNRFTEIVNEETESLTNDATGFKDQLGVLTQNIVKERDDLKQALQAEQDLHGKEVSDLNRELNQVRADRDSVIEERARIRAHDLTHIERKEKEEALERASQASAKYEEAISRLQKTLEDLRSENKLLREKIENLSQANSTKIMQAPSSINTPPRERKQFSVAGIVTSTILGVVAIVGLSFGVYTISTQSHSQNNNSQPVQTTVVSSSSIKSYASGDKWEYKKDGKSYEVTMDSPTTGTYTDDEGQVHQITLEKK